MTATAAAATAARNSSTRCRGVTTTAAATAAHYDDLNQITRAGAGGLCPIPRPACECLDIGLVSHYDLTMLNFIFVLLAAAALLVGLFALAVYDNRRAEALESKRRKEFYRQIYERR